MLLSLIFVWRFNNLMLENKFKTKLIKEIRERLPGAIVLHINPPPQGIPDLLVLMCAALAMTRTMHKALSSVGHVKMGHSVLKRLFRAPRLSRFP